MKQFELGDAGKVLLVKQDGKLSAIGTKCTHYGALLVNGALGEGRVRCPWHGACFNLETGDIEDFPGQDSIPCYKVKVEKGKVHVRAKKSELESNKKTKLMTARKSSDERTYVVIGGGPSGGICVEVLRQEGFTGRIVMICRETALPYDRVKVSKSMDFELKKAEFRTDEFYEENSIEVMKGVEATKVDSVAKTVSLSNGYSIKWDKMFIATGSKATVLKIPGSDLPQIVTMRDHTDSVYTVGMISPEKHVVVLGFSFIALEAAAYCVGKVARVTVIGRDTAPLKQVFGEEIGASVMEMFKTKDIHFEIKSGIKRCIGENGNLTSVELIDGRILQADILVMGVGSSLYTTFLDNSGIHINKDGSIDTDVYLQSNINDIYIGGDIANAPVFSMDSDRATIGHYPLAQYHGRVAALNMVGKKTALKAVPFFWTVLFGKSFRYSGHGTPHEIIIDGDLKELKFIAFYLDKNGKVIAMASCMRDPYVAQFAELLSQGKTLHKSELEPDRFAWAAAKTN